MEIEMPEVSQRVGTLMPERLSCDLTCFFSESERSKSATKLCVLIALCLISMIIEIFGGIKANSLAVLTDAVHLLTDVAAFSISLFCVWASGWSATSQKSFGFTRLEVLGTLLSVQLTWLFSGFLIYEAVHRILQNNAKVDGKIMFGIAAFCFFINLIMVILSCHNHAHHHEDEEHDHHHDHHHRHEEEDNLVPSSPQETNLFNINLQGVYLHAIGDLMQSVWAMIAGAIIWAKPHWLIADLICTLLFSVIVLCTTISILRNIFAILMEGTPSDIDIASLENGLNNVTGVQDVHDLHVWAITNGKNVMSCHVIAEPGVSSSDILYNIRNYCKETFRIHHVTIQIE